jgi:hypothetical protein
VETVSLIFKSAKKRGQTPRTYSEKSGRESGSVPVSGPFFPTAFAGDRPRFLPSVGVHFVRSCLKHDQAIHWDF